MGAQLLGLAADGLRGSGVAEVPRYCLGNLRHQRQHLRGGQILLQEYLAVQLRAHQPPMLDRDQHLRPVRTTVRHHADLRLLNEALHTGGHQSNLVP